jgi:formamidopyrimidine-DNA glycosylase
MPEIPEMELYKRNLNSTIQGKRISEIWVYRSKSINYEPEVFQKQLTHTMITSVDRMGKYLIFNLSNELKLLAHMMLDGRLYYLTRKNSLLERSDFEDADDLRKKVAGLSGKPSVVIEFEEGSLLFFCRLTLGYLRLYSEKELEPILSELGPDPLKPGFRGDEFSQLLGKASQRGRIKPWLMQQKNISGVGNAYSNESLFGAGILPTRIIETISPSDRLKLFGALREVLEESIRCGGDMEEPFTPDDHFTGGFNPHFQVYERAGKPCVRCGTPIIKEEIGGRNAFYCPQCQR